MIAKAFSASLATTGEGGERGERYIKEHSQRLRNVRKSLLGPILRRHERRQIVVGEGNDLLLIGELSLEQRKRLTQHVLGLLEALGRRGQLVAAAHRSGRDKLRVA